MNAQELEAELRAFIDWKKSLTDEIVFANDEEMIRWYLAERVGGEP